MVRVFSDVIQVVVLASSADALLGVNSRLELGHWRRWINCSDEDRLELVHSSICKKKSRVIMRDRGARVDIWMLTFLEKVEELLSHFVGGDIRIHSGGWRAVEPKRSKLGGVLRE